VREHLEMDKVPERRPFLEAIEQRRLRRHGERRRRAVASDARTTTYVGVIFRCVRSAPGSCTRESTVCGRSVS
jgi:hypothetical protein